MSEDTRMVELVKNVDRPRPLPADLRARLTEELESAVSLSGIDAPRPLPDEAADRIQAAVLAGTARARRPWLPAVAAGLVLVVGASGLIAVGTRNRVPANDPRSEVGSSAALEDNSGAPGPANSLALGPGTGVAPPFIAEAQPSTGTEDAPPPTASGAPQEFSASERPDTATEVAPATGTAIVLSTVGRDGDTARGFEAFVDLVNESGGIGGTRRVHLDVDTNSRRLATVNLSDSRPLPDSRERPTIRLEGPAVFYSDDPAAFTVAGRLQQATPEELDTMAVRGGGQDPSVAFRHGWYTAKLLSLALWVSGATDEAALDGALATLTATGDFVRRPVK